MISRAGNENFIVRHYDWFVAGAGVAALLGAGVFFALSLGSDAEEAAQSAVREVERKKPEKTGVVKEDMTAFARAKAATLNPLTITEIDGKQESFLASEKRVKCKCGKVIPGSLKACPSCGESLSDVNDATEAALRAEAWKKQYGIALDDSDKDGDGFTNKEEFEAKTDPTNASEHPDYFASLSLQLPLKETYVPFVFTKATQIPSGWRCEFFDPKQKDDYGRMGRTFTAVIGEEVGATAKAPSGYVLKRYEKKEEKRAIPGGAGMTRAVDVSVATVERKLDGKSVALVVQSRKAAKLSPVDVQATLVYERVGTKTFDVITGSEVDLNGEKYRVCGIKTVGKGAEVTMENCATKKKQVLKALE